MSQEASEALGLAIGIHQDEMLSAEDNWGFEGCDLSSKDMVIDIATIWDDKSQEASESQGFAACINQDEMMSDEGNWGFEWCALSSKNMVIDTATVL